LADGSKAKIRNIMSPVFSQWHQVCIMPALTRIHSTAVHALLGGNACRAQALFEEAFSGARKERDTSAEAENAFGIIRALSQRLRFREAEH
jgi:hypothetical protein